MDKILRSNRIRLEILSPLPEYAEQLSEIICRNRDHLDMWRGDVLKYETSELSFYKLLMDNYYYERKEGYFYHIFKGKKIIGHISLLSSGKFWETSYWLDKEYTGQGYMREALKTLENAWFQKSTAPITVLINPENTPSLKVIHKMGYTLFGQNRYLKNFAMFMREQNVHQPSLIMSANQQIFTQNQHEKD
ncbi:MAG: GNAT family N-acetyltransferase [Alphaproteobacteria bacterium]|nr:GNAT family N-acetyltransferase [Alphaproteobacteria bacterium]